MRIVVHGQQAFGKAVLEALLKRGENVVAVYVAPEKPGAKADPLKEAALAAKLPVYQPDSYKKPEVWEEFKALKPDLQVMAFVTLFVPEEFLNIPTHGSIQYHPSLLPAYRGASAINWPIIKGEKETGLSIFWPDNGLDTGDVLMQKKTPISDTDTLGTVYFDRLFPMGVDAMMESVDLVKAGKAPRIKQDESKATYEGRCGPDNAKIDWGKPWEQIDRLIRGCNPAPGAWTTLDGKQLKIFDAKPLPAKDPEGHRRQDRRNRRGRSRRLHRGLRRRPLQGHTRAARRRQEDRSRRMGEVRQSRSRKRDSPDSRHGRACPGHPRLACRRRGCPHESGHDNRTSQTHPTGSPHARLATSESEVRHRNRPGRQAAAASWTSPRKDSASRRKTSSPMATTRPRCRWTTSSRCKDKTERQADPGHRDHADAGGRGQDHDHGRPDRRAQSHRQKGDVCLREPSLGPCFGVKGGAAGGGYAQVVPMEDINLHFTGDFHAITSAHNLLSALIDNHIYWGNALGIDSRRVAWRRVMDMNDRALREIVCSLGGVANGYPREAGFDITVASEVMAIFCLATDLDDLKRRLGNIIVGLYPRA